MLKIFNTKKLFRPLIFSPNKCFLSRISYYMHFKISMFSLFILCQQSFCFQVELYSILLIDEVGQIFGNQFKLYMTWYDFRLKFHNMKTNLNMNTLTILETSLIWVPKLVFSNTEAKVGILFNKVDSMYFISILSFVLFFIFNSSNL